MAPALMHSHRVHLGPAPCSLAKVKVTEGDDLPEVKGDSSESPSSPQATTPTAPAPATDDEKEKEKERERQRQREREREREREKEREAKRKSKRVMFKIPEGCGNGDKEEGRRARMKRSSTRASTALPSEGIEIFWGDSPFPDHPKDPKPTPSILSRIFRADQVERILLRHERAADRAARHLETMQKGAPLLKVSRTLKKEVRWFTISADGSEIVWDKNMPAPEPAPGQTRASSGSIWKRFFGSRKTRNLLDVYGVHYGPFGSIVLKKYIGSNKMLKPWLCLCLQFHDRMLDLVCNSEEEVTAWFFGLQSLAPMSVHYLSTGAFYWQRIIMKINYYGLKRFVQAANGKLDLSTQEPSFEPIPKPKARSKSKGSKSYEAKTTRD